MSMRLSHKDHVNIPLDITRGKPCSNRDKTFITGCINELKTKGKTICFKEWHIKELKSIFENLKYNYNSQDECFYVSI